MAYAPDRCGCTHEHHDRHHGGHDDDSQHEPAHGGACCGDQALNVDNPKPAEKA